MLLKNHFKGKLKEVFLYITYKCNLKCLHCYMPDAKNIDMPIEAFEKMIEQLVGFGASKITLLGGEPTLHSLLPEFINTAKDLGITYIRMDTNGQFKQNLLKNPKLKLLNDICFSLDGIDSATHGTIRTRKNYYSVINNIKSAISYGYTVRVTMTLNSLNLSQVEQMASKLERLGVAALNLHLTSNSGKARHNKWLLVDEEKWINFYKQTVPKLSKYDITVKIPMRFAKNNDLPTRDITCEAAKASRLSITPDLKVYSCPLLL